MATITHTIRFTAELYAYLKALAAMERRSINAQLMHILEEYRRAHPLPDPPIQ